jgi:hypothetical protein
MSSTFRFYPSILVILSEAKDLLFRGTGKQQVLRFAQDDNLVYGIGSVPIDPSRAMTVYP